MDNIAFRFFKNRQIFRISVHILGGSLAFCATEIAQASGDVTLYGTIDTGMAYTSGQDTRPSLISGGLSDSLWGIHGTEEITDQLNVNFRVESDFDSTNGRMSENDRLFNRESWVGLAHKTYGKLYLGRQHTIGQLFGSGLEISSWKDFGLGATFRASNNFQLDSVVNYFSPSIYGFEFGIGRSFDTQSTSSPLGGHRRISAGLRYSQGPLYATLTYDNLKINQGTIPGLSGSPETWQLGASYDFDILKISAAWSRQKKGLLGNNVPDSSSASITDWLGQTELLNNGRIDSWYLGTSIPVGNGEVQAQWSLSNPSWRTSSNGNSVSNAQVYSVGYIYTLSPRTSLYAFAAQMRHMTINGVITTQGSPISRFAAGINHTF